MFGKKKEWSPPKQKITGEIQQKSAALDWYIYDIEEGFLLRVEFSS
jgi:hypothetical protein